MKKISLALLGMLAAGPVLAANTAFNSTTDTPTTLSTASSTYDYTPPTTDFFVVNAFSFTVSANVVVDADESGSAMAVSSAAAKGRNVFTGHSNGGSVSQCGTVIVPTSTTDPTDEVSSRLNIDNIDGCNDKDPIEAPKGT